MMSGKRWMLAALIGLSSPVFANDNSLLVNGVNAAVHGDIGFDKGNWRNDESYSALRLKAGFQLIRIGFVGMTIGFQKVGFYTAEKNWTKAGASRTNFDYRGPVAEFHIFPDAMFSFALAGFSGDGYSFTSGDAASFGVDCSKQDSACAKTKVERSRLRVSEISGQVGYTVKRGLQIFLGVGSRHVIGQPQYVVERSFKDATSGKDATGTFFDSYGRDKWKMDTQFFLFGVRGTTL